MPGPNSHRSLLLAIATISLVSLAVGVAAVCYAIQPKDAVQITLPLDEIRPAFNDNGDGEKPGVLEKPQAKLMSVDNVHQAFVSMTKNNPEGRMAGMEQVVASEPAIFQGDHEIRIGRFLACNLQKQTFVYSSGKGGNGYSEIRGHFFLDQDSQGSGEVLFVMHAHK